jgi:hypothetical protein
MNSRLVISLLCVGAIGVACRSHAHTDASTAPLRTRPADTTTKLAASLNVNAKGKEVRLALHILNTTRKSIELDFPNGQSYEFVVVDSIGREVWRWGQGRMFTQTFRNKFVDGGESFDVAERWGDTPPPGRYTAIATLTSSNFPVSERVDFTVR